MGFRVLEQDTYRCSWRLCQSLNMLSVEEGTLIGSKTQLRDAARSIYVQSEHTERGTPRARANGK